MPDHGIVLNRKQGRAGEYKGIYFLEIKGASHFSFNIRTSDGVGTRLLSGSEEEFDVITRYGIAFLEKYVNGSKVADNTLQARDPMLTRIVVVEE
jgi:hypothetical protein